MKFRIFCISILLTMHAVGQNKVIDSLTTLLATNLTDTTRVKVYSDLCWYYGNISMDSAFHYGKLALELADNTGNKKGTAQAYNDLGILYYKQADFQTSITYYKQALYIRKELKDSLGMASLYNKLGLSYQRVFKLDSALFFNIEALKIFESQKNTRYVALIKNNLANIHSNLKQYDKALKEHLDVASIRESLNDKNGLTHSYTNIGNTYLYLGDTLKCIDYYKKGITLAEELQLENELATLYNNYGGILKNESSFAEAENLFLKALAMREKRGDNYGVASVLLNLGDLYLQMKQSSKAEGPLRRGLFLAQKTNALELEINAYEGLLSYHAHEKNTDSILKYQALHTQYQDTLFRQTLNREITDIQEKYNSAQRLSEISSQKDLLLQNELKLKNRNLLNYLLLFGLLLLGVIIFGLFKRHKHKRREYQQELILKESQTFSKLQEQRLQISRDLHDNIGSQLTFIISSINNLSFLTKSSNEKLRNKLNEINSFATDTIAQFRDTIWAMNSDMIQLEDFQGRVLSFIEKAKSSTTDIQFVFDANVSTPTIFSSTEGINLFRVVQEAINNAIKHGNPSQISVVLKTTDQEFQVIIADDGCGFNTEDVSTGNGLHNMKKRMETIGGKIDISSKGNSGTEIILSMRK